MAQRRTERNMATTRSTSTQRGQKINACCISALHGNCSPSDKEEDDHARGHLFYFSLSSFPAFHLFTTNVTRALSLKAIKGKAGATSKENKNNTHTHALLAKTSTHAHHPSKETWDLLPLSKACNPYYEYFSARQHEQQQNLLDVGPFMLEPAYILMSALHTIWA
jgi:hypothetical protein